MTDCIDAPECTCKSCVNACHWCAGNWLDPAHECKENVIQKLLDQTCYIPKDIQIEMLKTAMLRVKFGVKHS